MSPVLPVEQRRIIVALALLERQGESVSDDVLARLLGMEPAVFAETARSLQRRRLVYRQRETLRATLAGIRAALYGPEAVEATA